MAVFNIHHGFTEAVLRGYRTGFLKDSDYHHLTQCETLDDIKMNLQETDYDQFLGNEMTVRARLLTVVSSSLGLSPS